MISGSETLSDETAAAFEALSCPKLGYMESELGSAEVANFYDTILEGKELAVED